MIDTKTIEAAFETFVEGVQKKVAANHAANFPTLEVPTIEVLPGKKYWKIARTEYGGRSVHCFVRKSDGAILKAAGWKSPYTKGNNYVRGYVTDDNALNAVTAYGAVYR